jgi:hypothetical protein
VYSQFLNCLRTRKGVFVNRPEDLVFPADVYGLPKDTLSNIARGLSLKQTGNSMELTNRIVDYVKNNNSTEPYSWSLNRIFAGRIAVSWFKPSGPTDIDNLISELERKGHFEGVAPVDPDEAEIDRIHILGAAKANMAGEDIVLVRAQLKVREAKGTYGTQLATRPIVFLSTLLLNSERNYLEMRASSAASGRFADYISNMMGIPLDELRPHLIAPFAERIEEVADRLGGIVSGTVSKPDTFLENLIEDQVEAILDALDAVGVYLGSDPDDGYPEVELETVLRTTRERLTTELDFTGVPFSSIMLAGLQTIGMKAEDGDARKGALYKFARPGVQHHGGFIRFPTEESSDTKDWHSIRLGTTTNSVSFNSKTSESAIKKVRDVILHLDDAE